MAYIGSVNPTNAASSMGQNLGQGLGGALQNLISSKLDKLQQQQSYNQFLKAGYPQEAAQLFSNFRKHPDILKLIQNYQPVAQEALAQEQSSPLNQLMSGGAQPRSPQQDILSQLIPQRGQESQDQFNQRVMANPQEEYLNTLLGLSPRPQQQEQQIQQQAQPQIQQPQQPRPQQSRFPVFKKPLTEADKIAKERLEVSKQKESRQERTEAFKLTQQERKEINDKVKAAKSALHDLSRLEELQEENKLDTPGYVEFLKRSGLDIPALMQEGSQEYNKIVNNFVRDAKNIYGSRITNQELEQYLKTLPSLSQSPGGRQRVLANLRLIRQGDLEYGRALDEVIKENKGIPPLDLSEKINEKIDRRLDMLSDKFKKDLAKPVPPAQNRYVTALQASLGNIVGGVTGGGIKGATKGAVLGAGGGFLKAGPAGVIPGAVIGGLGGLTGFL